MICTRLWTSWERCDENADQRRQLARLSEQSERLIEQLARLNEHVAELARRPLLKHLAAQAGGKGRLFRLPVEREMAEGRANQTEIIGAGKQARRLRDRLTAAGVTRDALHNTTEQAVQITFHDLRATGITRCALRGDSMISIRDRAGHTDVEQTNDYVRRASSGQRRIAVPQASKLCIPQQLPAPQFICAGYCAGN